MWPDAIFALWAPPQELADNSLGDRCTGGLARQFANMHHPITQLTGIDLATFAGSGSPPHPVKHAVGRRSEDLRILLVVGPKLRRVLAIVLSLIGEGQKLDKEFGRPGELLFEVPDPMFGVIERLDIEELERCEFVWQDVSPLRQRLERAQNVMARERSTAVLLRGMDGNLEQKPDQTVGFEPGEFHLDDVESRARPIDVDQLVDNPINVFGALLEDWARR